MKEELCKLGILCSTFESSLFYYQSNNSLDGILITHVDDFCWGGTKHFRDSITRPLKNIFSIGTEFEQSIMVSWVKYNPKAKFQHHIRSNPVHP